MDTIKCADVEAGAAVHPWRNSYLSADREDYGSDLSNGISRKMNFVYLIEANASNNMNVIKGGRYWLDSSTETRIRS